MAKKISDDKGFTVVELLIALALLGIVLSLGYFLFFGGTKSFDTGTARANVQQNVRLVNVVLKNELRNAILISTIEPPGDYDGFFQLEGSHLMHNGEQVTADNVISDIDIDIKEEHDNEAVLLLTITAVSEEGYTVNYQILLNNLKKGSENLQLDGVTSLKDGLYYKNP